MIYQIRRGQWVGGMIVYRNGRPYKAGYRKFTIRTLSVRTTMYAGGIAKTHTALS
ncbi:MAG: hypothetical protein ACLS48_12505 [[Eubacterium] siraeum]